MQTLQSKPNTLEQLRSDSEKTQQEVTTSLMRHYWDSVDAMIHALNRDGIRVIPNSYQVVRGMRPVS